MAAIWQKDSDGVEVAHSAKCPRHPRGAHKDPKLRLKHNSGRCNCPKGPSWRRIMWDADAGKPIRSPAQRSRDAAVNWQPAPATEVDDDGEAVTASRTFGDVAREWFGLYCAGRIPKRRGTGAPSRTTILPYRAKLFGPEHPDRRTARKARHKPLVDEWGHRPGDEIEDIEWQTWFNELGDAGLSRSHLAELRAIVRSIYAYARMPSVRIWTCPDPTANLYLPAEGTRRKWRTALVPEAKKLLAALPQEDRVPHALAMGAGLRRSEIARVDWADINLDAKELVVRVSKSDAGTNRPVPIMKLALSVLKEDWIRQGKPEAGKVVKRSVLSGKYADACDKAWKDAGLTRLTLQEGRRTYASTMLSADYSIAEIMQYMGHADLAATQRYLDELPQPGDISRADRLHALEDAWAKRAKRDVARARAYP